MAAPLALVVDVHPLLALPGRLDHRAVGIENRFPKEGFRLLSPDFHTRLVEHVLGGSDVSGIESAAEVFSRRGIGDPPRPEGIQVALVVPRRFQVLVPCPTRQEVVRDVQDAIRLVVRQVHLEQAEAVIDQAIEPQPLHQ